MRLYTESAYPPHSFKKYLLRTYYMPDTGICIEDTAMDKDKYYCLYGVDTIVGEV